MKKFTVICDFQGGQKAPFDFFIGSPEPSHNPIAFQMTWLSSTRNGAPPQDIVQSLQRLYDLSKENDMDFEELCFYAMSTANQDKKPDIEDPSLNEDTTESGEADAVYSEDPGVQSTELEDESDLSSESNYGDQEDSNFDYDSSEKE